MGEKDALAAKAPNQVTQGRVKGITFDAGGLIALERNDRRVFSIPATALEDGDRIIVPATLSPRLFGTRRGRYAFGA